MSGNGLVFFFKKGSKTETAKKMNRNENRVFGFMFL